MELKMNILVATKNLNTIGGCESYTYAIIEELSKFHNVEYFTLHKGILSDKIENELGIKYMSRKKYDLILANHIPVIDYLFGKGFIIQTCHGIINKFEQPSRKADGHVSITTEVKEHLASKKIKSKIIYNGINLKKFRIINPVSLKINTVLSLCQGQSTNEKIATVCNMLSLNFKTINKYNNPSLNIQEEINEADIVIGIGRSAYDAMACGRPVIIYDERDYFNGYADGYILNDFNNSLKYNCSGRAFKKIFEVEDIIREIRKYNADDSQKVRNIAEKHFNIEEKCNEYINYYTFLKENKSIKYYVRRFCYYSFYSIFLNNYNKSLFSKTKLILKNLFYGTRVR